jgi:hypothetical protein
MFLLIPLVLGGAEDVSKVRAMVDTKRYQQCYSAASMTITSLGNLDADPELFLLKGQCAYEIGKFDDAIKDLSRFIASRRGKTDDLLKRAFSLRGRSGVRLGL